MSLRLYSWFSRLESEDIFWWSLEVGLTLVMVAMPMLVGFSILGIHPYDSFISTLAPGDLFVFSVVLITSAASMGQITKPPAAKRLPKQQAREADLSGAPPTPDVVKSCLYIASIFIYIFYFFIFTLVKTQLLQIEHKLVPSSEKSRFYCAVASVLAALIAIVLAACMRHLIRYHLREGTDARRFR